jgi:hypothetical protein
MFTIEKTRRSFVAIAFALGCTVSVMSGTLTLLSAGLA